MNPDAIEELFHILDKHDVKYILIGGIAAVLHGSPYPTEDIDITPRGREKQSHPTVRCMEYPSCTNQLLDKITWPSLQSHANL